MELFHHMYIFEIGTTPAEKERLGYSGSIFTSYYLGIVLEDGTDRWTDSMIPFYQVT